MGARGKGICKARPFLNFLKKKILKSNKITIPIFTLGQKGAVLPGF
jgi:hypothetical protein